MIVIMGAALTFFSLQATWASPGSWYCNSSDPSVCWTEFALKVDRDGTLQSGLSPAIPFAFAFAALACWAARRKTTSDLLAGNGITDIFPAPAVGAPAEPHSLFGCGCQGLVQPIVDSLQKVYLARVSGGLIWASGFCVILFTVAFWYSVNVVHPTWLFWLAWSMWFLNGFLIFYSLHELLEFWRCFESLLRRLAAHPLGKALADDLSKKSRAAISRLLLAPVPHRYELIEQVEIAQQLPGIELEKSLKSAPLTDDDRSANVAMLEAELVNACASNLWRLTGPSNAAPCPPMMFAQPFAWPLSLNNTLQTPKDIETKLAAMQLACTIRWCLHHMETILTFTLPQLVFLLASMHFFFFQPRAYLLLLSWAIVLVFSVVSGFVMRRLSRNEMLSRISGTPADKVTWNAGYLLPTAVYTLGPILGQLAFHFPQTSQGVFVADSILKHFAK